MAQIPALSHSPGDPKLIQSGHSSLSGVDRMVRNMGWISLALGFAEIFGARRMTRSLGMRGQETLVRSFGFREIAAGVLCLSLNKQLGVWSRVIGDGLDIAVLSRGLRRSNPRRQNVKSALAGVVAITAVDIAIAAALSRPTRSGYRRRYSDRSGFPHGIAKAKEYRRLAGVQPFGRPLEAGSAEVT